jgi:diguanylate cyclase (GGDEF)-like protein
MFRSPIVQIRRLLSAESRWTAVVLAAAAALVVAASLAIGAGRDYVAAVARIDRLTQSIDVAFALSSTSDGPVRLYDRATNDGVMATLRAERAAAQRHLEATQRSVVLLGALTIAFVGLMFAMMVRAARHRKQLQSELSEGTNHDPQTNLPNRRFFAQWLTYAIAHARRERKHVGVLFIDINGCAAVREFHGEAAATDLLIEIARRFRAVSREGDLFARLGPTEFALATPSASDGRELAIVAQRLRDQLNESSQAPLADTPIGASIGIAFFPEDADDSAGVMAAANAAMYAARRAGRNHVAFNALAA